MVPAQARQKGVILHFKEAKYLDPSLLQENMCIEVDRSKFSQCLRNLISNAIKFSSPGGSVSVCTYLVSGTGDHKSDKYGQNKKSKSRVHCVELASRKLSEINLRNADLYGGQMLRIEVYDNGPGISEVFMTSWPLACFPPLRQVCVMCLL